jgi:hypothetical protein
MIPTRGASTSISSKASSTSGRGSSSAACGSSVAVPRCGSKVSTAAAYPGTRTPTRAAMSRRYRAPSNRICSTAR